MKKKRAWPTPAQVEEAVRELRRAEGFTRKQIDAPVLAERKIKVLDVFEDDHLPCVTFKYGARRVSLFWTDAKTIGALYFPEGAKAQMYLRPLLRRIDALTDQQIVDGGDGTDTKFGAITPAWKEVK